MLPFVVRAPRRHQAATTLRFLLVCLLACSGASAETPDDRKAVAHRVYDEILSQGKFEVADEIYASDFVNHGLSSDATLKQDQEAARGWRAAAPDLRTTVQMMLAEGELVTVLWVGEGTNTGVGNGLPATGKRVRARGITIFRISGGRIREEWSEFDMGGLLLRLGLLVPAAPAGSP